MGWLKKELQISTIGEIPSRNFRSDLSPFYDSIICFFFPFILFWNLSRSPNLVDPGGQNSSSKFIFIRKHCLFFKNFYIFCFINPPTHNTKQVCVFYISFFFLSCSFFMFQNKTNSLFCSSLFY